MNVSVIGTGYVGLVTGACFSEFGVHVVCVDQDSEKVAGLQRGEMPIYEPGLDDLVRRNADSGRLHFSQDTTEAVRSSLVVFIAVGTPPLEDGSTDLRFVEAVARDIGRNLEDYSVIVTKSTVPVGTAARVRGWVQEELDRAKRPNVTFSVASNPEFLREGAAISDFMRPDRVVIGVDPSDERASEVLKELYRPLYLNETPFVLTNIPSAELAKYAANAFLATKISFANEVATLCEEIGGDVQDVARAMGLDRRIGPKFLHAGAGFGGSCFPKDTASVAHFARELGVGFEIVEATMRVNSRQRERMVKKIEGAFPAGLAGTTLCVLGLSFKPETDDIRDAPAMDIIAQLQKRGVSVRCFDPEAMSAASKELEDVTFCKDAYDACQGADGVILVTEWNEFRALDLPRLRELLNEPILIDLRNVYEPSAVADAGFAYYSVGRS